MYIYSYLETNNIGANGCAHLAKADWKHLTIINLCIIKYIQKAIRSEQMAVGISVRLIGKTSPI